MPKNTLLKIAGYRVEAVYMTGLNKRLDHRLEETAGKVADHGTYTEGNQTRDLMWDFFPHEFNLVVAVANRMSRIMAKYVSVRVYIFYEEPFRSTRLNWNQSDKEMSNAVREDE